MEVLDIKINTSGEQKIFTISMGHDRTVVTRTRFISLKLPMAIYNMAAGLRELADDIDAEEAETRESCEHKDTLETLTLNHQFNHL